MAGSSDSVDASARLEYLYASNANVSNFISVKLSSEQDYHLWKTQMYCLMKTHKMAGIVDDVFVCPSTLSKEIMDQYDNLLRGWILGSTSEKVLGAVVGLNSAKDVWDTLNSFYATSRTDQHAPTKLKQKNRTKDANAATEETLTDGDDMLRIKIESIPEHLVFKENKTEGDCVPLYPTRLSVESPNPEDKIENRKKLREATIKGDWIIAESILKEYNNLASDALNSDGSTTLHTAVGIGHNDFVRNLLMFYLDDEQVIQKRDSDGSTALHIAAIVGNTYATDLLVKKNRALLKIKDLRNKEPLDKAYENMHLDTIGYLLKVLDDDAGVRRTSFLLGRVRSEAFRIVNKVSPKHYVKEQPSQRSPHPELGLDIKVDVLVNAISAKQYSLATDLIQRFPKFASKSDDVLMAIARTFPSGLDYWETLIYPSKLDDISKRTVDLLLIFIGMLFFLPASVFSARIFNTVWYKRIIYGMLLTVPMWILSVFVLIYFLMLMICYLLYAIYNILWKGSNILGGPTKHIENKKNDWNEANEVLRLVCDEIDKLNFKFRGTHHPCYTRPLLEAASQNAYKVVDEILYRSPEAIQSTDKSGYDIIQLAIIHRSEKIYNLIYDIGERKNLYRTVEDSSKNNILHLAGRLAPSHELNRRRGAALQLQNELQWREEVKKHIFPTYITRENIFKETPDMLFTREHEKLVKEGENWMKTTAESCSITAALIATIMFAAAITVPGGNNQETGIPLFTTDVAFIIFAVSDAISLFASSTALLVFLSILTARFAENDFLVSLPSRMLIGLFSLLLSTIAMMVAFSATLFLVFCHQKPWIIGPICVLAFIPIGFFVALQFPLIVDLFRSTYPRIFGKQRKSVVGRFNPDNIRLLFRR